MLLFIEYYSWIQIEFKNNLYTNKRMDLQKFLERKAEENQVRFSTPFVDLLTEMRADCT
jgi:hypothetical protein